MSFALHNGPHRFGATVLSGSGSGLLHVFADAPTVADINTAPMDSRFLGEGFTRAKPTEAGDYAAAAAANATITLTAPSGTKHHAIHGLDFGYSATPTSGYISLTDGTSSWRVPVTSAGAGFIPFAPPKVFGANAQVVATLGNGGAGVSGYIAIAGRSLV